MYEVEIQARCSRVVIDNDQALMLATGAQSSLKILLCCPLIEEYKAPVCIERQSLRLCQAVSSQFEGSEKGRLIAHCGQNRYFIRCRYRYFTAFRLHQLLGSIILLFVLSFAHQVI